jgi:hypothetical protein
MPPAKTNRPAKELEPTGIPEIDRLSGLTACKITDYVTGVSAYVRQSTKLTSGRKKAGQIRLSNALARALVTDLVDAYTPLRDRLVASERKVAGALRVTKADVSETHPLDGLRLAVELKPINLAVGRAIWNRFGDIRTFAVNLHLKFPFAVVGGVLVVPTYEEVGTKAAEQAEAEEAAEVLEDTPPRSAGKRRGYSRKSTLHLVERAIERLVRAGGRTSEADAPHLLEGIAVLVYDPDQAMLHPDIPAPGAGLRWEEFVRAMAASYRARFEN